MSFLILFFSTLIYILVPWWVGFQVRVLIGNFYSTESSVNGIIRYALDFAYGVMFITYAYIIAMAVTEPVSEFILKNFGLVIIIIAIILTICLQIYKPGFVMIQLGKMKIDKFELITLISVFSLSFYAILVHPYVYDSAQLLSVVKYVNPENEFSAYDRGMVGYSSLVLLTGSIFNGNPISFIASAAKVPLGIIFLSAIMLFSRHFSLLNYRYSVIMQLVVLLSSTLGLYGFITLGKDSIIGIAFMWLFFSLWLSREDNNISELDLVFVLLAASTIGIVTIPYVFFFFIILALNNILNYRLWTFTSLFFMVGIIPLSWVMRVVIGINPYNMAIILAIAAIITGIAGKKFENYDMRIGMNGKILSFIPIISLAALFYLMPLSGAIINPEFNFQWQSLRPPLDGNTKFLYGLMHAMHTETLMSKYVFLIGWTGVLLWGLFSSSPTVKAIVTMPFLVLFISVLHVENDWLFIRYRLLWDLYKDVPQWMSGLYVGVGMLAITLVLLKYYTNKIVYMGIASLVFILSLLPLDRPNKLPAKHYLLPTAKFNDVAGHRDELIAAVIEYNSNYPTLKFALFQQGISPGPTSFSRSFGYDSFIFVKQEAKVKKRVVSGEAGIVCYKSVSREHMLEFIKRTAFTVEKESVIKVPEYFCDKLKKD